MIPAGFLAEGSVVEVEVHLIISSGLKAII